jgi:hypothetical protein
MVLKFSNAQNSPPTKDYLVQCVCSSKVERCHIRSKGNTVYKGICVHMSGRSIEQQKFMCEAGI